MNLKPVPAIHSQRPTSLAKHSRGFTLIEVLVALSIVAVALLAGMRSTDALSRNASRQSTQWLAQICAENEFSKLRLSRQFPGVGESSTDCQQAGFNFQVNLSVNATPNPNFRRLDARVVLQSGSEMTPMLQLSTVMGRY